MLTRKFARLAMSGLALVAIALLSTIATARDDRPERGLSSDARVELSASGVDKYLGEFTPASSSDAGGGWTKHTYDTEGGDGPICIAGTPF